MFFDVLHKMTETLEEALKELQAYRSTLLRKGNFIFYENLLLEDVSEAIAGTSFLECCGLLSVHYRSNEYYPALHGKDIFSYLVNAEDYRLPLQLVLLTKGQIGRFYVARTKITSSYK